MLIRDATADDWPAIWAFMHPIVIAGETFSWDTDIAEVDARERWFTKPPGHTVVAVEGCTVLGTAESHTNHGGNADHIAGASFMVDPAHAGNGVGRALGDHVVKQARADGYRAMQFNAVVETNTAAVRLWQSLGFDIDGTLPDGFRHPTRGYVGLHIMYQRL